MNNKIYYTSIAKIYRNNAYTMYLNIYTLTNNFMKHNPPCKQCLIQGMCIRENLAHPIYDSDPNYLHIKACNDLKEFVANNEIFFRNKN
jgi:hypothetical protein